MSRGRRLVDTAKTKTLSIGMLALAGMAAGLLAGPLDALAVDSGRLIEKDGQYVFVESQDPSLKLLMDRAYEKGIITKEEYEQALKES
nr:hypothetical protein [Nitrospirota bacterium]